MSETIFSRIINREIPADIVHEDDQCLAFRDINPQAPVHILVIPKKVIPTVNDLTEDDEQTVGHLYTVAARIAKEEGIAEDGFRTVMNCNEHGGQSVYHIHLHLIGGKALGWPPFPNG
ncbi:MAG: histidine triad nucleotide-binding protein [Pseudomonadota bacterium]